MEYMVDVQIDGEKMSCLQDSGAGDNYMSFELFKRLFQFREYSHSKEGETVRAANDSEMRIYGYVTAMLDFGSYKSEMKLILLDDLIYDAVLGIGFFDKYVRSIRPSELRMEMQDGSIVSFRKSSITKMGGSALVCADTVTVLPYSKSVIPCNIINTKPSNQLMCISDTGPLAEKYGIMMPYCLQYETASAAHSSH